MVYFFRGECIPSKKVHRRDNQQERPSLEVGS
jgi:hypothetical protein